MDISRFLPSADEKPLDRIIDDGGFTSVFRTIGCVGDSLSSGEFESTDENGVKGYHDYFEYSWGQYIARAAGLTVYNFSRGGMTAKEYFTSFAEVNHFWDSDKLCQAYILALGANDLNGNICLGSTADINKDDYTKNGESFAGYYAKIISRLKTMQPNAKFFLVTMPHRIYDEGEYADKINSHAALLNEIAEIFDYTYVIDLAKYADPLDDEFRKNFYLGGHMSPAGYQLFGKIISSYIDYIIRHNFEDFSQVGFIGKPFHNMTAKW